MTVTTNEDLVRVIEYHIGKGHERGCPGRQYRCDCRRDMETTRLLLDAAKEIKRLKDEIGSLELELEDHRKWG